MRVAVENILLINFLMDFSMLVCAIRPFQKIRLMRTILAAVLGAAASAAAAVLNMTSSARVIFSTAALAAMLIVACGMSSFKSIARSCAALLVSGAVCASLIPIFAERIPFWPAAAIAALVTFAVTAGRKKCLSTWDALVEIEQNGRTVRFYALVDTGNRLSEPMSGLPVMIASQYLLEGILPETFDPENPWRTLPKGFRLVSYGGVGGTGEMACFMPDDMFITADKRRISRKNAIWVAVYPGKLPGKTAALAPISAIQ